VQQGYNEKRREETKTKETEIQFATLGTEEEWERARAPVYFKEKNK
jgi:hypothetical protein